MLGIPVCDPIWGDRMNKFHIVPATAEDVESMACLTPFEGDMRKDGDRFTS